MKKTLAQLFLLLFLILPIFTQAQKSALLWATYLDSSDVYGGAIATDASGNVYFEGTSTIISGLATKGAYQTLGDSVNGDIYLAKFDSSGNLIWATYFGGDSTEWAGGVTIDKSGNVYITGTTESTNGIATSGAYLSTFSQSYNAPPFTSAFLAKFNTNGNLIWATYYGGNIINAGGAATDSDGNVFITGLTGSTYGIATSGAHKTSISGMYGDYDAYLAKFSANGSLLWGTYYGGTGNDGGGILVIDKSGDIYMYGGTNSISGIATAGAYQTKGDSVNWDVFLAKFNTSGTLLWGTYYGGDSIDEGGGMAIDKSGNIIISGTTNSINGIATSGAYQTYFGGIEDAFLAKFTSSGNLLWGTYFGDSDWNGGAGVVTDFSGNIYMSGYSTMVSGLATAGAYQTYNTSNGGGGDAILSKFNSRGELLWASYYGGCCTISGGDLSIDSLGNVYMSGVTGATTGISTSGSYESFSYGGWNAYLAKYSYHNWL